MRPVVLSLLVGLVVVATYALVGVRRLPPRPIVALVGLLGVVLGERLTTAVLERGPSGPRPRSRPKHESDAPASRTEDRLP